MNTSSRLAMRAALIATVLPLAGCMGTDRLATGSIVPDDYRDRHPIVINDASTVLDVYASGRGLDPGSSTRVRSFAEDYRSRGRGPMTVMIPRDRGGGTALATAESIKRELASTGVNAPIQTAFYDIQNPGQSAPIRLSFVGLKASVATRCGEWPADLASGSSIEGWENRPFWNHGCSYQSNLATQIADPRDLAAPRGESSSDVAMRTRAITNVRNGSDPGTSWKTQNTSIGQAGGN